MVSFPGPNIKTQNNPIRINNGVKLNNNPVNKVQVQNNRPQFNAMGNGGGNNFRQSMNQSNMNGGNNPTAASCTDRDDHATTKGQSGNALPLFVMKLRKSGHQLGEQIRIDIAAGEHDDDVLAARRRAPRKQRRKADRAAGLDHELQLAIGEGDGCADFLVRRGRRRARAACC